MVMNTDLQSALRCSFEREHFKFHFCHVHRCLISLRRDKPNINLRGNAHTPRLWVMERDGLFRSEQNVEREVRTFSSLITGKCFSSETQTTSRLQDLWDSIWIMTSHVGSWGLVVALISWAVVHPQSLVEQEAAWNQQAASSSAYDHRRLVSARWITRVYGKQLKAVRS